jgi:putative tryptophan/tyrosine transport system substrate-binding protein
VTIRRRILIVGALAGSAVAAGAQQADKVWRIGYLGTAPAGSSPESDRLGAAFIQGLRDSGFVEGRNIAVVRRATEGRVERAPALIAELIGLRVDVLLLTSTAAARAAKEATTTTPIVVALLASDAVSGGLVASLARPGANLTGLTVFDEDLGPKRLEWLKAAVPRALRVALIEPDSTGIRDAVRADALNAEHEAAARRLGVSLLRVPLKAASDLESATAAIMRERADAVLVGDSPVTFLLRQRIADFAMRQRLPAIVAHRSALTGGALMSYGPDLADNFRKAATYVAKILRGANPAELPIERPTKVELVINLKTAKALGITIPPSVLLRADEVIE